MTEGRTIDIQELNEEYAALSVEERIARIYHDFGKVLFTSSFGTTAGVLLYYFSRVKPEQPVHFIDTSFHFRETLDYKDRLARQLGLTVIGLHPESWKNDFTRKDNTWAKDPDLCCTINKVEPVEKILPYYDVWISGLMAYQNANRRNFNIFEEKGGKLRFYPVIDFQKEEVERIFREAELPRHPLEGQGYDSIGCRHCTFKGKGRRGRWPDSTKIECGLHQ